MRYLIDLGGQEFSEGEARWIHAMPMNRVYKHPLYGKLEFNADRIQRFADNVKKRIRGIDLDIDYDHKAKTSEAAGWVKDAEARTDGLWLLVEFTKDAAEKVKNKAYRYFSPEFIDKWTHPETGVQYSDVVMGGGLTNRPFLKDLVPINLSEVMEDDVMDDETRKLWAKVLGLPETATETEVSEALKNASPLTANKVDLSKASVAKQDDGTYKITADGADGEIVVKPEPVAVPLSEDASIKALAESNPAVARMLAEQEATQQRLRDLEMASKLSEASVKLSEVGKAESSSLPPAVVTELREVLAVASPQLSEKIYNALNTLAKTGFVKTGQIKEGTGVRTLDESESVITKFLSEVDRICTEDKVDYSTAIEKVRETQPQLYSEYIKAEDEYTPVNNSGEVN